MFGFLTKRARHLQSIDGHIGGIWDRIQKLESAPTPADVLPRIEGNEAYVEERLDANNKLMKELTIAVAEGIERVDRSERRVKATVARARKELKERGYTDPGLEAEAHELRVVDGDRGEDGAVQPVPTEMAEPADAPSSVRGVSASDLRRVRGI